MFEVIEMGGVKTVTTKAACNHVYVVDVSGSMYHDLPKIRQHLKNIISMVAQPQDTFSVIWFSGRNQCGVAFENILVSDASTVDLMHKAIDRYLTTVGLTGFVDPLQKAMELNLDPSKVNNFIMLTDGYDNQSNRQDIITKTQALSTKFQSVSFIEYGYYADRAMLSQMADAANGNHIFAEGIVNYERVMEEVVSGMPRVNNIEVAVNKRAKHCVYIYQGQIKISPVTDGKVSVPEDVERVHSIVPGDVLNKQLSEDHLYLILFYAAKTVNSDLVWSCLQALGDVNLVEAYQNAFTKQELSEFELAVENAVLRDGVDGVKTRFISGKDLNAVPQKNSPTVINLLEALAATKGTQLVLSSPYWSYKRIGRGSEANNDLPRFVPSPMSNVSLNNLVFNSERPNVSISTQVKGVVELPPNEFGLKSVPSFITRNYTIIKDGIRNVEHLPVLIPADEFAKGDFAKFKHEVIESDSNSVYVVFNLAKIPVINRGMVEDIPFDKFKQTIVNVEVLKSKLKVLGHYISLNGTQAKIKGMVEAYGEEAATWLSSIGVRDYGYSAVGTTSTEATDEYESIQVVYKIKGLSSLPSIKAVNDKIAAKKNLNLADSLISGALLEFEGVDHSILEKTKESLTNDKRKLESDLAQFVYALVLGRKWFSSDDEIITTTVDIAGGSHQMTVEKVRKMISL